MPSSLGDIRARIGQMLGRYVEGFTNASGHTTTTVVVDQLISSIDQDHLYEDFWLIFPDLDPLDDDDGVPRQVASFESTTGTLTVNRPYSSAAAPNFKGYQLHGHLEPSVDLAAAVNAVLERLTVVVELTVTPVANAVRHPLTAATTGDDAAAYWLTRNMVRQVGFLTAGEDRDEVDPFRRRHVPGELTYTNGTLSFNTQRTFTPSETLYFRCLKPAYYHCRDSAVGVFGEVSGLAGNLSETELPIEIVAAGAIMEALERSYFLVNEESDQELTAAVKRAAALFTDYCRREDPRNYADGRLTIKPPRAWWGPTWAGYR